MTEDRSSLVALGARVHLFVAPHRRETFVSLFRDVLNCNVVERDSGMAYPIVLVAFPDGSSFSVEFSELAPAEYAQGPLDDERALRGAWIEFRTRDVEAVQEKLRAAGVPEFRHPPSPHVYFSAPGGQVFRVIDVDYKGP